MTNPILPNPYSTEAIHPTGDFQQKTTVYISGRDVNFFTSLYTHRGWLQATVGILLKKLKSTLESHNIITYDPDRFHSSVTGLAIILPGDVCPHCRGTLAPAIGNHPPQANSGDVGRGTPTVARVPNAGSIQPADPHGSPAPVRRKGRSRREVK